jgi:hypothetical protein
MAHNTAEHLLADMEALLEASGHRPVVALWRVVGIRMGFTVAAPALVEQHDLKHLGVKPLRAPRGFPDPGPPCT